jgi:signal peptidase II
LKVLFISAAIILADQLSKFFFRGFPFFGFNIPGISHGVKKPLVGDTLGLTLLENPGFAFGIDPGTEYKMILTFATLLITIGLIIYLYKTRTDILRKKLALALIIGGAAGNLIDRIFYGVIYDYAPLFYGKVVDFISLKITGWLFFENMAGNYVFNIADIAVAAGLLVIVFSLEASVQPETEHLAAENQD